MLDLRRGFLIQKAARILKRILLDYHEGRSRRPEDGSIYVLVGNKIIVIRQSDFFSRFGVRVRALRARAWILKNQSSQIII